MVRKRRKRKPTQLKRKINTFIKQLNFFHSAFMLLTEKAMSLNKERPAHLADQEHLWLNIGIAIIAVFATQLLRWMLKQ